MKKIVLLAALLAGGLVAYNYVQNGTLSLLPGGASSEEERALRDLERELDGARKDAASAGRGAGLAGLDTTSDVGAARETARRVERELAALVPTLEVGETKDRAERLLREARALVDELR